MVSTVQETPVSSGHAEQSAVLLLPSHLFFVRSLDLPAGISAEEVPSFVELSLEQISPFALNQLYYGYYLPADASRVLIFAAYRKQLSIYEDESWTAADLVLPEFASALGLSREAPTLVFLQNDFELTAVYWAQGSEVPDRIVSRRREADEEAAAPPAAYEELRRKLGPLPADLSIRKLDKPRGRFHDKNLVFDLRQEGEEKEVSAEIARPVCWALDIRDKGFLQTTRRAQRQNRLIWTGVLGIFAAFAALAIFEAALFAGEKILDAREARIQELEPEVNRIMQEEELAVRLEELHGERLLPFEMLSFLNQYRPPSIYYTRVSTDGVRSFEIEALTPKSQDVDRFQRLLEENDALESVEIRGLRLRARDGRSSFVVAGTFQEGSLSNFASPEAPEAEETPAGEGEPALPEIPTDLPPEAKTDGEATAPQAEMPAPGQPAGEEAAPQSPAPPGEAAAPEVPTMPTINTEEAE